MRQSFRQAAGGGQQKVTAATGGVDDPDAEQCLNGSVRMFRKALLDDRVEGRMDQFLDQGIGGVLAAGQLAGLAGRGALGG